MMTKWRIDLHNENFINVFCDCGREERWYAARTDYDFVLTFTCDGQHVEHDGCGRPFFDDNIISVGTILQFKHNVAAWLRYIMSELETL